MIYLTLRDMFITIFLRKLMMYFSHLDLTEVVDMALCFGVLFKVFKCLNTFETL